MYGVLFNDLFAQRDSGRAERRTQRRRGWTCLEGMEESHMMADLQAGRRLGTLQGAYTSDRMLLCLRRSTHADLSERDTRTCANSRVAGSSTTIENSRICPQR